MEKSSSENMEITKSSQPKKSSENEGYKKMENLMNTTINNANIVLKNDIKSIIHNEVRSIIQDEFKSIIQNEFKQMLQPSQSNSENLPKIYDFLVKMNTTLLALSDQVKFDNEWLKLSLESALLQKNEIIDLNINPIAKGGVEKVAAKTAPKAKVDTEVSSIKSTNFLKHQMTNDSAYIAQKFTDNEEHMSNCFCEHIKSLPLAKTFKELPLQDKIDNFLSHIQSHESTNTKLVTLLNKNPAFKKSVSNDFDSWKSQNKVNNNKDFLNEED